MKDYANMIIDDGKVLYESSNIYSISPRVYNVAWHPTC